MGKIGLEWKVGGKKTTRHDLLPIGAKALVLCPGKANAFCARLRTSAMVTEYRFQLNCGLPAIQSGGIQQSCSEKAKNSVLRACDYFAPPV